MLDRITVYKSRGDFLLNILLIQRRFKALSIVVEIRPGADLTKADTRIYREPHSDNQTETYNEKSCIQEIWNFCIMDIISAV